MDGVTHLLPRPFMVLATQNPIEYEGTFPLPEAQLDRFLLRLPVGYPEPRDEKKILVNLQKEHPINSLKSLEFSSESGGNNPHDGLSALLVYQQQVWDVYVDETLQEYIIRIVEATRNHPDLALGGSPRASLALYKSAQAFAAIHGRDHIIPDDIKFLTPYTILHRLILKPEAELRGRTAGKILQEIVEKTPLELGRLE